jgi:aromatic amino acid aminotransferase I
MWLEVDHTKHPQFGKKTILELEEEIFLSGVEEGVLVSRGSWFLCERNKAPERLLFRATFAAASNEKMAEAMERFAGAVKKSFGIN